ncbi:cytochrome P450 [Aspergillus pseudoustus]|uniref:Cytochrome P450 n=1 Tax=Aspergillus pseudoustus TaxID=1810923 RepID=A0ABR4KF79_9EURO
MLVSLIAHAALAFCLLYYLYSIIYAIYLHPLRRIPGPKLWIASPFFRHISAIRGLLDLDIPRFHLQHGPIVRVGRDEVSFIDPDAWNDIYGHNNKHGQLPKVKNSASNPLDIVSSNDHDHSRYRKSLSHAFSTKGLQEQEPYVNKYVDQLLARLKDVAQSQTTTDMSKWYELTTFDIVGDLTFGEPFGGLVCSEYHDTVKTIFESVKLFPFVKMRDAYPILFSFISLFIPKRLLGAQRQQNAHTRTTVMKRLANSSAYNRGDFMDSMTRNRGDKDGLTDDELVANANILIVAGSETTATLLAGVTYFLLRNPESLRKVVTEVRSAMQTESDISSASASARLPYMWACIQEGFRLYPPVPTGLQRVTLDTMLIAGQEIPRGTSVAVHPLGASWSPSNFHAPDRFLPERWLPEARTEPASPFFSDKRDVVQPFSVGPRNCIGRNLAYIEMRLILGRILWNFDLELCEESLAWYNQRAYTAWEKPPLMCRLTEREI